jgi:hypothetical protein
MGKRSRLGNHPFRSLGNYMIPSRQMNERLSICRACEKYRDCPTSQRISETDAVCPLDPPRWNAVGILDFIPPITAIPSHLTPSTASDHEKQGRISGCCDSALNY